MNGLEQKKFDHVVLGGTFDRLHDGHRKLISTAVEVAKKSLTIGVSDNSMTYLRGKRFWEIIQPVETRIDVVQSFVDGIRGDIVCNVFAVVKDYQCFIEDEELNCTVVTDESLCVAQAANNLRQNRGMLPLDVVIIESVVVDDVVLSSTEERVNELVVPKKKIKT